MDVVSFRDVRTIFGDRHNYPRFQIMACRTSCYFFDVSALQLHHGVLAEPKVLVNETPEKPGPST